MILFSRKGRIFSLILTVILGGVLMLTGCTKEGEAEKSDTTSTEKETSTTVEAQKNDTELPPSTGMSLSSVGKIGESGYCAVGKVNTASKTAKVLLEDGTIVEAKWDGDAPEAGMVNKYQIKDGVYSFSTTPTFPAYGDSFKDWAYFASGRQKKFYKTEFFFMDEESTIFVRYSDTEWRVFRGRKSLIHHKQDYTSKIYFYLTRELDKMAKVVDYAMVVGQYDEKGKWAPANKETTQFLDKDGIGWDSGDKNLS